MSASFMTPEDKQKSDKLLADLVGGRTPVPEGQMGARSAQNIFAERMFPEVYAERKASEQRERLRPQNAQEEYSSRQRAYAAYDRLDDDESIGLGGRRRASAYLTKTLGGT